MSRIRITIEYDTDGNSVDTEIEYWQRGEVDFLDIASLAKDDPEIKITFEKVEG